MLLELNVFDAVFALCDGETRGETRGEARDEKPELRGVAALDADGSRRAGVTLPELMPEGERPEQPAMGGVHCGMLWRI